MALINNPNSWNGGTAVFNAAPITETYLRLAAHRQAKNDAFDRYHQKQLSQLDTDGIKPNDSEGLAKRVGEWNQHWQANKDRLLKGDIKANVENDQLFRKAMAFVNESKDRQAGAKEWLDVGKTLKKENGVLPDSFTKAIDYNNRPIDDNEIDEEDKRPKSRRFNAASFLSEAAPWDMGKGMKKYDHIPKDTSTSYGETNPNTGMRLSTKSETFSNGGKQAVAAIAGSDYHNDPSFTKAVNSAVADPNTKKILEDVYTQQMGKAPEHPEEYATALILSQQGLSKTEQKEEKDDLFLQNKKYQREQEGRVQLQKMRENVQYGLQALRAKNAKDLANYRSKLKSSTDQEKTDAAKQIFDSIVGDAKKNGLHHVMAGGQKIGEFYEANVPASVKGEFGRKNDKGRLQYPDKLAFNPDGTVKIVYYKTKDDKDGNPVKLPGDHIDNSKSQTITTPEFQAVLYKKLFGVKTASGADYGDDNALDDDEEQPTEIVPISKPTAAKQSSKKKIPGF